MTHRRALSLLYCCVSSSHLRPAISALSAHHSGLGLALAPKLGTFAFWHDCLSLVFMFDPGTWSSVCP